MGNRQNGQEIKCLCENVTWKKEEEKKQVWQTERIQIVAMALTWMIGKWQAA